MQAVDTSVGHHDRVAAGNRSGKAKYIIGGVVVAAIIAVVIYLIVRKNNSSDQPPIDERFTFDSISLPSDGSKFALIVPTDTTAGSFEIGQLTVAVNATNGNWKLVNTSTAANMSMHVTVAGLDMSWTPLPHEVPNKNETNEVSTQHFTAGPLIPIAKQEFSTSNGVIAMLNQCFDANGKPIANKTLSVTLDKLALQLTKADSGETGNVHLVQMPKAALPSVPVKCSTVAKPPALATDTRFTTSLMAANFDAVKWNNESALVESVSFEASVDMTAPSADWGVVGSQASGVLTVTNVAKATATLGTATLSITTPTQMSGTNNSHVLVNVTSDNVAVAATQQSPLADIVKSCYDPKNTSSPLNDSLTFTLTTMQLEIAAPYNVTEPLSDAVASFALKCADLHAKVPAKKNSTVESFVL